MTGLIIYPPFKLLIIMMRETYDRLDTSGNGLAVIALLSFLALAVIAIIGVNNHRDSQQTTRMWIKHLALNKPTIVPSERGVRFTDETHLAIVPLQSPYLPYISFSTENMMAGGLKPEKGEVP